MTISDTEWQVLAAETRNSDPQIADGAWRRIANDVAPCETRSLAMLLALTHLWQDVVAIMYNRSPAGAAMLRDAIPIGIDGNNLITLKFTNKFNVARLANNERGRKAIEDIINRELAADPNTYRIRCVLNDDSSAIANAVIDNKLEQWRVEDAQRKADYQKSLNTARTRLRHSTLYGSRAALSDFRQFTEEWGLAWWETPSVSDRFKYGLSHYLASQAQGVRGTVYVLKAGDYYKIGRSTIPATRIRQLKIQLPQKTETFARFDTCCCVAAERFLHLSLAQYRANGEWFELPTELAALLKQACEDYSE